MVREIERSVILYLGMLCWPMVRWGQSGAGSTKENELVITLVTGVFLIRCWLELSLLSSSTGAYRKNLRV
jgi:hypothetical protein